MYKLFFILSVFIFAKVANAQDADIVYKHAVSVNLTSPLIQAINKNKPDSTSLRIPTNLAYSFTVKNKWILLKYLCFSQKNKDCSLIYTKVRIF